MSDPQHPYYAPTTQPATATATNTPGRIGFIVGLVGLGIGLLSSAIVQIIIRSPLSAMDFNYAIINIINGFGSFLALAASLVALILGIVGLRKAGFPHAQAGIATGLGIAGVTGGVFTLILVVTPIFY